ncbi:MAG: DEAD/DEAH box helicase [Bacteroidia bacterium]|jgi:ATP-dependent RNA helicase RhlE
MKFDQLNLSAPLLRALSELGYENPTPIQAKAIPHVVTGRDLFGCAQTGTGKTAAFALPILEQLQASGLKAAPGKPVVLVLAPTRELALQIEESFRDYGKYLNLRSTVVFGGVSQHRQAEALRRGCDILIATPGRLLDLMEQNLLSLNAVKYFVLDEADRMLDMGFIHDMKKVIARLPKEKQTCFFSATVPAEVKTLSETLLQNPVRVSVDPENSTTDLVNQELYKVSKEDKRALLKHLLQDRQIDHALVFTRTKRGADRVARDLVKSGIPAEAIHGDKSQPAREKALDGFKNRRLRVLVATDIAARGIDVDRLSHVINFEIPEVAETYVHRIGRTGRAGKGGIAISFCTDEEMPYVRSIQKLINKSIPSFQHPYAQ